MSGAPVAGLSVSTFNAYLEARGSKGRAASVQRIGGGASRETWLIRLEQPVEELPPEIVVRKDTAFEGVIPTPLEREFTVMRALSKRCASSPAVLVQGDTSWFGAVLAGQDLTAPRTSDGSPGAAARLSTELARALATLHRLEPQAIPLGDRDVPASVEEAALAEVERWYRHWCDHTIESAPMLEEVTWWLRRSHPATDEDVVVVWGDVGVANTVCSEDGRVLAMSDWELASYGDPMRDLASALWRGVGLLAGREHFLQAYAAAGGRRIDTERIAYYDVFMNWQVAIFSHLSKTTPEAEGTHNLHPNLLSIWAHRINLHKAGRQIGV